ncbi:hypothetical protein [Actinokineospora sp. NPDC004072]
MAWVEKCGNGTWRVRYRRDDNTIGSVSGFSTQTAAADHAVDVEFEQRKGVWRDPASAQVTL